MNVIKRGIEKVLSLSRNNIFYYYKTEKKNYYCKPIYSDEI